MVSQSRRILTLQELCDLERPRPRFEGAMRMPDTPVWLYSVDGRLNGEVIKGALFAENFIGIKAKTKAQADEVAEQGLQDTIKHAQDYAFQTAMGITPQLPDGISVEYEKRIIH